MKKFIVGIGKFFKGLFRGIWTIIKWFVYRIKTWHYHTKEQVSRVYLVYASFISGIIGFYKSIKAQYLVWKDERKEWIESPKEDVSEEEVVEKVGE